MSVQVMERGVMERKAVEDGLGASSREAQRAFGQAVQQRRKALNKTQHQVAVAIGIKDGVMSQMELGLVKSLPGPTMMRRLASTLQTTPEALLAETGYLERDAVSPEQAFTATLEDVNRLPVDDDLCGVIREAVLYAQKRWEDEQSG